MGMTTTMWGPWRQHGDHGVGWWVGKGYMGMWRQYGDNGDDVGMTGTMWGPWGPHISKNANAITLNNELR